jgi:hypothetical protein
MLMDASQYSAYTSMALLERLRKRFNRAQEIADLWESILEASFHYAVPFRNRFYLPTNDFQGTMQNARLFDTTAVEATKTFVSKIQDTMTPPQVQWGYLEIDEDAALRENWSLSQMQMAQQILDDYMRRLFKYVHMSNFDVVINECYFDLAIGTSCLVINQGTDKSPFLCTSIPIDKLCIEEAVDGKIRTWFRTWEDLKISELNTRWQNIQLSNELIAMMMTDPDARVKRIYEGVAYFPDAPKPYCYAVWHADSLLMEEWQESNPGIVWRFQKINNETWGRGPVMDALPTIISLNEMARIDLAAANLETFKPYMGFSDSVFNPHTFRLEPFTVIPIAPIGVGGQAPLVPLPGSSNPQFAQLTIADLRMQVKTLMFAETPTDSASVQPQTAYELALRQQTLAQKIGPLFSRLEQEFLTPVYERFSYILHTMGLLPRPKLEGVPIRFKYRSPLALAKGQQDIARFTQYVQLMQGIMGPQVTQIYINPKTTPYLLAEALQVDPRYINSVDSVSKVMQNVQNKQSAIDASGMTPEQPENPSEQLIAPPAA